MQSSFNRTTGDQVVGWLQTNNSGVFEGRVAVMTCSMIIKRFNLFYNSNSVPAEDFSIYEKNM